MRDAPDRECRFGPELGARRPGSDVAVSDVEVAFFSRNGYLLIDGLMEESEIERLRDACEGVIGRRRTPDRASDLRRLAADDPPFDDDLVAMLEVPAPEVDCPDLLESPFLRRSRRLAAGLLGVDEAVLSAEGRFVVKPPGCRRDTPWHQDGAYCPDLDHHYDAVSIWLSLDHATAESGCLHFIPGSHLDDVRPHRRLESGVLTAVHVDATRAVAVPLAPGAATVHHAYTLHHAGPNATSQPRRAYVWAFEATPRRRRTMPAPRPWLVQSVSYWRMIREGRLPAWTGAASGPSTPKLAERREGP